MVVTQIANTITTLTHFVNVFLWIAYAGGSNLKVNGKA